MNSPPAIEVGQSFRDPGGQLFAAGEWMIRVVNADGRSNAEVFLQSPAALGFVRQGKIIETSLLEAADEIPEPARAAYQSGEMVLRHPRVWFPSYPYEWCPDLLYAAGKLTLELAEGLLEEGLGLKDATPYNILFLGSEPVFVDVLSIERRQVGDPQWLPYAQFVRTFLLPLIASRYLGWRLDDMLTRRRDGCEPEEIYRLLSPVRKIRRPFLSVVSIPTWLGSRMDPSDGKVYAKKNTEDPNKASYILRSILRGLRRQLEQSAPAASSSRWTGYMELRHYSEQEFAAKQTFVETALASPAPRRLLDVGCNTGHFSILAARNGAEVVAIDSDPAVVNETYRAAKQHQLNILPLVVDLARPTPAVGWRNTECKSFLDRARQRFDVVMMLAVLHHLVVTERVPLDDILAVAAELTNCTLIIEFVPPEDPMFLRLVRGRGELYRDVTRERFEAACRRQFALARALELRRGGRVLYELRKIGAAQ